MRRTWVMGFAILLGSACAGEDEDRAPHGADGDGGNHKPQTTDAGSTGEPVGDAAGRPDAGDDPSENIPSTVEVLLDRVPTTIREGRSPALSFEVPADTISVTVTVRGDRMGSYVLGSWVDDGGNELVSAGWEESELGPMLCIEGCTNRVAASEATFASIAPNNQDAVLNPGTHTIDVIGFRRDGFSIRPLADEEVEVSVLAKTRATEPTSGVLDLNLHFSGAGGWTAENAAADPGFREVLDEVNAIYAQAGVTLGEIQYFDIDAQFRMIESTMGGDSDLMALLSQAASGRRNALNVYFVDALMTGGPFGGFGVLLGIAGGIPGPPLVQGDPRGGVVIAVESHKDPQIPGEVFTTMAHEVGHFLGLFHTSEQAFFGPQLHDPLEDTPENDDSFLMFNTGSGRVLSDWQGRVMRTNPWVRHGEVMP